MSKVSFSFNDSKMVRAEWCSFDWSLKAKESCGGGGNFKFPEETDQREAVVERFKKAYKFCLQTWGIFLPNLRILSRKNNEPTPFILFLAMTVTTNTSDRPNVSLVHF